MITTYRALPTHLMLALAIVLPDGVVAQNAGSTSLGPSLTPTSYVAQPLLTGPTDLPIRQEMTQGASANAGDYLLTFGGAVGVGVIAGGVLAFLGSRLGDPGSQENPLGIVGGIALGGLGYSAGSVLGAYAVGSRRHPKDSMKSTWMGGLIGMLAGTAIGFAQPDDNLNGLWLPAALLAPPVGAVIGFFR